ncbi:hypothetical protein DJ031_04525 [bacterium endosymbiont of Escarpia laminata]|nr:MAG: hypothetical protein DJ031_04525 [bacterium endosymbiont of Escarpia laminata]
MTGLIPVYSRFIAGESTHTVSARKLHEFLGVRRDFSSWIKNRIKRGRFVENQDFILIHQNGGIKKRGGDRRSKDYWLTIDMAKMLGMLEHNDKGDQVRRYFIDCERQLHERHEQEAAKALPAPADVLTRDLRAAINRKAHALSLRGYDAIRAKLETWVKMWAKSGSEAHALEKLETFDGQAGEMVFVNAETLWSITAGLAAAKAMHDHDIAMVRVLENETGRNWYGRPEEATSHDDEYVEIPVWRP